LKRLEELQRFKLVTAPFAGVVTARGLDIGTLVTSTTGAGQRELFRLATMDPLRVLIGVPQSHAAGVREGQKVALQVPEHPQRTFAGVVSRTSRALDPASRTLLTEVRVANQDLALRPGMYARASFTLPRVGEALTVPASALVIGAEGTRVVVVDGGVARYRSVGVGRDFGPEVEVLTGLAESDRVVTNPTEALTEGARVEVHQPQAKKG
jgi:RND family efflux transporter MFP subunit